MTPSYSLGITFIVLVSLIWAASSVVVQYLYQTLNFNSPFLLTYIGTSLFIIFIPSRLLWERWSTCRSRCNNNNNNDGYEQLEDVRILWRNYPDALLRRRISCSELISLTPSSSSVRIPSEDLYMEVDTMSFSASSSSSLDDEQRDQLILCHVDHIRIALKIAPIWFISNYCYNLSLAYTTITSSTVLSSTGSVFTFLFSLTCGDEQFTKWKTIGVLLAFCGSIATSIHDMSSNGDTGGDDGDGSEETTASFKPELWGDIAGLVAAVGYGGYTVLIRKLCPKDESLMSMQLLLGYIGAINMIFLSPVGIWLLCDDLSLSSNNSDSSSSANMEEYNNSEDYYQQKQHLTGFILFCVVMKGLFDNVLSDYLWARAIILTSATVATVGLGLTIPLALLSDAYIMKTNIWSAYGIFGAVSVLMGFVFVNIGELYEEEEVVRNDNSTEATIRRNRTEKLEA